MFLAFFPFSEVVYIVAIFLAWIYIAFGLIGNSHATENNVVIQPDLQVQEAQIQKVDKILSEDRTCVWENHYELQVSVISEEIQRPLKFFDRKAARITFHDIFLSACLNFILPNRAPPVV